jgi:hypothetical protein
MQVPDTTRGDPAGGLGIREGPTQAGHDAEGLTAPHAAQPAIGDDDDLAPRS